MESIPETTTVETETEAIYLTNTENELCILDKPEDINAALKIRFIRELYGRYTFCRNRIGASAEHAIMLSYMNFNNFIHVLNLLKLQIEEGDVPFTSRCITYNTLISEKWEMQILPRSYLSYVEDMTTETLVECMSTCSQLSLHELRQLLMYRIVFIFNQKEGDIDIFRSTWNCILSMSDYDLAVFQKKFRELTSSTPISSPQAAVAAVTPAPRKRSQSF
jgi:hypothetical protein